MVAAGDYLLLLPSPSIKESYDKELIFKFVSVSFRVLLGPSTSMITTGTSVLSKQATLPASTEFVASHPID